MKKEKVKEFFKEYGTIIFAGSMTLLMIGGVALQVKCSKHSFGFENLDKPEVDGTIKEFCKDKHGNVFAVGNVKDLKGFKIIADKAAEAYGALGKRKPDKPIEFIVAVGQ